MNDFFFQKYTLIVEKTSFYAVYAYKMPFINISLFILLFFHNFFFQLDEEDLFMVCDLLAGGDLRYHLQQKVCMPFFTVIIYAKSPSFPLYHLQERKKRIKFDFSMLHMRVYSSQTLKWKMKGNYHAKIFHLNKEFWNHLYDFISFHYYFW